MTDKKVKIRKKSKFWLGYGIYMGVLLVLVMVLIIYVWNTRRNMRRRSGIVVEDLIKNLESGDVSSVKTDGGSKFEPEAGLPDTFADEVRARNLLIKLNRLQHIRWYTKSWMIRKKYVKQL